MRSPTQLLEDKIAQLESQIYDLEHPEETAPSVLLHQPRISFSEPGSTGTDSSPASLAEYHTGDFDFLIGHPSSSSGASSLSSTSPFERPAKLSQMLLERFLSISSEVGFFLRRTRFPTRHPTLALLSPVLADCVCLWGARCSTDVSLQSHESILLSRAVQSISSAIVEEPRHNLIDLIQAEVLLAVYFYSSNRFLEGRYHCNAAITLTLCHRLNDISAAQPQLGRDLLLPNDVFTSEEWNDAFWVVFTLDKVWGAVAGLESHFNGAQPSQVGIPWPLEITNYSTSGVTSACWGVRAAKVLSIGKGMNTSADAVFILHAKAAALFERVSRLASQWKASLGSTPLTIVSALIYRLTFPDPSCAEQLTTELLLLGNVIDIFKTSLASFRLHQEIDVSRKLLVIYTLAHSATIKTQEILKQVAGTDNGRALMAAQAVARDIESAPIAEMVYIDPICAILWSNACRVLLREMNKIRLTRSPILSSADQAAVEHELDRMGYSRLRDAVRKVLAAINVFAVMSPLMGSLAAQAAQVQREVESDNTALGIS
ncbi:hypothetical protein IEO21_06140 [Rhodonia placenta]|uniref:Xylanolytic transcriptional activator regulatory domain-containing protein n=1 Tax=Rhodonia placenta TaxID=104341 RepID=A0A8H7U1L3_9APHY|nr:hypothetical protein IEO21_06140 [Postia placenta]